MATIQFRTAESVGDFQRIDAFVQSDTYKASVKDLPAEMREVPEEGLDRIALRMYFPGGPDELQLFEVELAPDHVVQAHAHREDEIIYVTRGQVSFGANVCGPGSAVLIPENTLYGFKAGPEGARFLNFRAREDFSSMTKEEFAAARAARRAG